MLQNYELSMKEEQSRGYDSEVDVFKDCLKIVNCYDIPPFRQTFEFYIVIAAGTWNRRNNSKNNSLSDHWRSSMSFSSFVAFGSLFRRGGIGMLFLR